MYNLSKRAVDLAVPGILVVALAPVLLAIAAAVRLDSRGAALFRQERVGRNGCHFWMYKFRSMTVDSPTFGPKPESMDDERVTRVGRFLRRTSFDELPQLLNVLRGEMSLVGPRPEQPFLVERYETWQRERLMVLPGMTGWWQVNGRKQPMHDHVEEDLFYVRHRSLWLDLRILALTVIAVFRANGAR